MSKMGNNTYLSGLLGGRVKLWIKHLSNAAFGRHEALSYADSYYYRRKTGQEHPAGKIVIKLW